MVYLFLYDGRPEPESSPADWGTDGPRLGPFESVSQWGKVLTAQEWDHTKPAQEFRILEGDYILHDGVYYGQWSFTIYP